MSKAHLGVRRTWRALPLPLRRIVVAVPPAQRLRAGLGARALQVAAPDDHYDRAFYEDLEASWGDTGAVIARSIVDAFAPRTLVDLGCGAGRIISAARDLGVDVVGIERSEAGRRACARRGLVVHDLDLTTPFDAAERACFHGFDVAVCTEVAEHLPATAADDLVARLAHLAPVVVFTAATPGQGGADHVNEQPHAYWITRFRDHGFGLDETIAEDWRRTWRTAGIEPWYPANLMIYRRGSGT